ncbi:hypothetical protein ACSDBR_04680 [Acidithiobacillus ferriphilus]|uniref:hypothetical protein n=1 Tax=Acidithiobacillus ferriphilus TaxID=1689834 RepID=UPI002DBBED59|nr:hypothetical protein [Acidithiobacillus ferriphilus]MEB8604003.1 hypothetical protein [Acidithiobacillus ferriphilus]
MMLLLLSVSADNVDKVTQAVAKPGLENHRAAVIPVLMAAAAAMAGMGNRCDLPFNIFSYRFSI